MTITLLYMAAGGGTMNGECDPFPLLLVDTDTILGDGGDPAKCITPLLLHSGTCTRITAVAIAVGRG